MKDTPTNPEKMSKRQLQQALAACQRRCEGRMDLIRDLQKRLWKAHQMLGDDWLGDWFADKHCPSCNNRGGEHLEDCKL